MFFADVGVKFEYLEMCVLLKVVWREGNWDLYKHSIEYCFTSRDTVALDTVFGLKSQAQPLLSIITETGRVKHTIRKVIEYYDECCLTLYTLYPEKYV